MFPNYEALKSGVCRFIGRRLETNLGNDILDQNGRPKKSGAFVILDEGELVEATEQNKEAVRKGDLAAGDDECVRLCGLRK